jgi:putative transposase
MFKRSSHAVFDCRYHVIWTVKYRKRALLHAHEREECERVLRRAAAEYGMEIDSVEVDVDHVHLYIQIPPQRSVGGAVGILKSISARMMFKRFPYLKRKLWAGNLWSAGYFARTVGEGVTGAIVRRYIELHQERALGPAQAELFPAEKKPRNNRRGRAKPEKA